MKAFATIQGIRNAHVILAHDMREKEHIENSIFSQDRNENWRSTAEALRIYHEELEKRVAAYTKRTGQKLQKRVYTALEIVIRVKDTQHVRDVLRFARWFEKKYDTKTVQISIHRDEGHVENGKPVLNEHAHILVMGLDSTGRSIYRQVMKRKQLIELQDANAEMMEMERGERGRHRKHMSKKEYVEALQALREEKQKTIEKYQMQKNWYENYQHYFDAYNQIVQDFKNGKISKEQAKDILEDAAGMFSRQDWEDLPIRKAKQMATLGLLAAYHVQGNQKGENAVVREIDRGKEMTTEALEEAISMILSFTHKNLQQEVERDA